MRRLASILFKDLLFLGTLELLVRVVAGLGFVSLPPADVSGFDRLQQGENAPVQKRLNQLDRNLIFRLRANADLVYPRTALYPGKPTTYRVQTNDRGFRTPAVAETKLPGVFRIACLGDSSTFGMNVEGADAYPQVLARLLEESHPGRFEVLNFGVPGYSSRQGLELLRQEVRRYEPDLVTFAFGTNDRFWHRTLSDDELIRMSQGAAGGVILSLREGADHLYTYRLLKRGLILLTHRGLDAGRLEQSGPPRVSIEGMRDNIIAAHALLGETHARLIVLNNDFMATDARDGSVRGAEVAKVPYLDMYRTFHDVQQARTQQLAAAHHLPAAESRPGKALFRVYAPGRKNVSVQWNSFFTQPVNVPLNDDGTGGDQVASDGIWSGSVAASTGEHIWYKYLEKVDSDFVPEYRETFWGAARLRAMEDAGSDSIDTFGEFYLHSDTAHPDEEGHRLIARSLLDAILADDRVAAFLVGR